VSAPFEFLKFFAGRLRAAGIRYAVTSGMACVHYGLQQTTKDSDWIVAPEHVDHLRELLLALEAESPAWRVSYRQIFGAPLETYYLGNGWTSHLLLTDAAGLEHKVDFFGKPPRVRVVINDPQDPDFADRDVVAQMKRTDRPRDWPIVDGLGWQLVSDAPAKALVHLQDPVKLLGCWDGAAPATRENALHRRPLLGLLRHENNPDRLDGFLRLERMVWECVNDERYGLYTKAWKTFYRTWQAEPDFDWPVNEPFAAQHQRVSSAAHRCGLVADPLTSVGREAVLQKALARAVLKGQTTHETLELVQPPIRELLP
jgi:hypothetical protein